MLILDLIHHMQISIEVHRKTGLSWLELMGLLGDDVMMSVPRRDEGYHEQINYDMVDMYRTVNEEIYQEQNR